MEDEVVALGHRLRDLNRGLRVLKQLHPGAAPPLPAGAIGLLMDIRDHPDGCQGKALAARAALDPSTVSRAVASLVDRGLIVRHADPTDGRASVLAITDAGRDALAATERRYGDVLGRALAGWTPAEVAGLTAVVGRFATDLHALTPACTRPAPRTAPHTETLEAVR